MKFKLPALVPWMALAGSAFGQIRSADVLYTCHQSHPEAAYRVGDECFVPVETLADWGWKTKTVSDHIEITEGNHAPLLIATRQIAGHTVIPFRRAIEDLGGDSEWGHGADTLSVYSSVSEISLTGSKIHISAKLPFQASPFYLNPGKTVLDLTGVRLSSSTAIELSDGARAVQYRPNVVRVYIQTNFVPVLPNEAFPESGILDWEITRDQDVSQPEPQVTPPARSTPPPVVQTYEPPPVVITPPQRNTELPALPPAGANRSTQTPVANVPRTLSLSLDSETESTTDLTLHISPFFGGQAVIGHPDAVTLNILLPGLHGRLDSGILSGSTAIESASEDDTPSGAVVQLHLARAMGSQVSSSAMSVHVTLYRPKVGDGRLAGKIVVVDPGHGGHDRGAHVGDCNEKDLTLAIGKLVAAKLAERGATVVMTRQSDVFIPLTTRSQMSNQSHADLFISCHINSTGNDSRQSGTITFYHKNNRNCSLLAQCIQDEIKKVNGLPNLGVWSDTKIYDSGFSVLRNTFAPAVLIEMGFINHPTDRQRMLTSDFQESVSAAVVKGVRVYLGEIKPNE